MRFRHRAPGSRPQRSKRRELRGRPLSSPRVRPWLPRFAHLWAEEPMKRVALRGRFTRPYWRRRMGAFGSASVLPRPEWVYGPHKIEVGRGVIILGHIWLSAERATW